MTAHTCLNGGSMGFREPSCVACNEAKPATPATIAARCGCQCHGPYVWDVCPHCRPDLLPAAPVDGLRAALEDLKRGLAMLEEHHQQHHAELAAVAAEEGAG